MAFPCSGLPHLTLGLKTQGAEIERDGFCCSRLLEFAVSGHDSFCTDKPERFSGRWRGKNVMKVL
jgi:hypothetical protein